MSGRDFQVFTAVMIFSGTLVVGMDQFSAQSVPNHVTLVEDAGSQAGSQEAVSGISPIDARDNSRMDNRRSSGAQDSDMSRSRPSGPLMSSQSGPIEYDPRRDNSRLDSRYDEGLMMPTPPSVNPGR